MSTPRRGRAGFSLVEILVVISIIGLLLTLGFGAVRNAMESSRVTTCRKHLADIGQTMLLFKDQRNKGRWPRESGIRFLLTLHKTRSLTGRDSDTFLCPGTPDVINDTGPSGEPGSSYDDWDNIDSMTISYAGRDAINFPIRTNEDEVIASDDNERGPNHRTMTNLLYADGDTVSWDIDIDGAEILANFPEYAEFGIPVGPDSPHPPLQVLRID